MLSAGADFTPLKFAELPQWLCFKHWIILPSFSSKHINLPFNFLKKENKSRGGNTKQNKETKFITETSAWLLQNLVLHHRACLRSFLHSLGRAQGSMFVCPVWNQTLREALWAITHGSAPGQAGFTPLEGWGISKCREDWQKILTLIFYHFTFLKSRNAQLHLSIQMLAEVPSIAHTLETAIPTKSHNMIYMRAK